MSTDDEELDQESDEGFWGQLDDAPEAAEWAGDELEEAYLRAMEALEASDAQFPDAPQVDLSIDEATHAVEVTPPSGTGSELEQPLDGAVTATSAVPASSADRIDDAALAVDAGARIVGGCCGTTPSHLAGMRSAIDSHQRGERPTVDAIVASISSWLASPMKSYRSHRVSSPSARASPNTAEPSELALHPNPPVQRYNWNCGF